MLEQVDLLGSPFVGVVLCATDRWVIHPPGFPPGAIARIGAALGVPCHQVLLDGSTILGALMVANSRGIVTTPLLSTAELEALPGSPELGQLQGKFNAAGNNILANDRAALVNPSLPKEDRTLVAQTLGVEVHEGTIAGLRTVGSAAVVTNKGLLCHPRTSVAEREELGRIFGVPAMIGTANYGSPMLGAAVVANGHGAVTGLSSTGIELGRIEEALQLF